MAEIKIKKSSWLNFTRLLQFEETYFWDHFDFPEIPFTDDDRYVQLSQLGAHRLDLIAHDFYGDANLMWVILLANDLDYPNQAVEGQTIRLPSLNTINLILKKQ